MLKQVAKLMLMISEIDLLTVNSRFLHQYQLKFRYQGSSTIKVLNLRSSKGVVMT